MKRIEENPYIFAIKSVPTSPVFTYKSQIYC